jgi:hypothetical protein
VKFISFGENMDLEVGVWWWEVNERHREGMDNWKLFERKADLKENERGGLEKAKKCFEGSARGKSVMMSRRGIYRKILKFYL